MQNCDINAVAVLVHVKVANGLVTSGVDYRGAILGLFVNGARP